MDMVKDNHVDIVVDNMHCNYSNSERLVGIEAVHHPLAPSSLGTPYLVGQSRVSMRIIGVDKFGEIEVSPTTLLHDIVVVGSVNSAAGYQSSTTFESP